VREKRLSSNLRKMIASGAWPILLGLGVWIAVSVSSLMVIGKF
jgi:hypothetical protein